MVKFRDHEKLQLLTGERQSGGVSPPRLRRRLSPPHVLTRSYRNAP